jgi:hypothetical protein
VGKPTINNSSIAKGEQANNREVEDDWPIETVEVEDHVSLNDSVRTKEEEQW